MWLTTASSRIFHSILGLFIKLLSVPLLLIVDLLFTLGNLLLPRKKHGQVSALQLQPLWPAFQAPSKGESRSPCVALNSLANHGIIARSGRGIGFPELQKAVQTTFNTSPTFARLVTKYAADMLGRDFKKDTLDLNDLCVHNGIEADGSWTSAYNRGAAAQETDVGARNINRARCRLAARSNPPCSGLG